MTPPRKIKLKTREYNLIDTTHNKAYIKRMRMCETICKILLQSKDIGCVYKVVVGNQRLFNQLWHWDNYPPRLKTFENFVTPSNIKWYIHDVMKFDHHEWNVDFLNGLLTCGKKCFSNHYMPIFRWRSPKFLVDIFKESPFGGVVGEDTRFHGLKWVRAAHLYFRYSEHTPQFMAGVLATGDLKEHKGKVYAVYNEKYLDTFKRWGIPVERVDHFFQRLYVSPIWGALMSIYMPSKIGKKWLTIEHPYGTNLYCPVLWYVYCDTSFPRRGIPYLKTRRRIFYEYKCEEGALKRLEMLRLEKGLTQLDERIRQAIFVWKSKLDSNTAGDTMYNEGTNNEENGKNGENGEQNK